MTSSCKRGVTNTRGYKNGARRMVATFNLVLGIINISSPGISASMSFFALSCDVVIREDTAGKTMQKSDILLYEHNVKPISYSLVIPIDAYRCSGQ